MKVDSQKLEELLGRNVEEVIEKDHLGTALLSGKKLRVKLGIDPTSPDLHLGHAVALRKLREFQELGHKIVLIVGDFTGRIGDPSGRNKARVPLTAEDIKRNMKGYLAQAGKIIDIKKAEIIYNSEWFKKDGVQKLMALAMAGTFEQVMHRADFKKRIDAGEGITLLEILYPLIQGYDSVMVKADVELGGTDQKFNLLAGRQVQKYFGMAEQDVMTLPLLVGLDGVKKMSKSLGNYIGLSDKPADMFGKVMSVPDALVESYFLFCTEISQEEIAGLRKELGPKEVKERLGIEIVKLYHGDKAAMAAHESFEKTFSKKEVPDDIPTIHIPSGKISVLDLVMATEEAKSRSDARRLIEQGGFDLDGNPYKNPQDAVTPVDGSVIKLGKRRFFRLKKGH